MAYVEPYSSGDTVSFHEVGSNRKGFVFHYSKKSWRVYVCFFSKGKFIVNEFGNMSIKRLPECSVSICKTLLTEKGFKT